MSACQKRTVAQSNVLFSMTENKEGMYTLRNGIIIVLFFFFSKHHDSLHLFCRRQA